MAREIARELAAWPRQPASITKALRPRAALEPTGVVRQITMRLVLIVLVLQVTTLVRAELPSARPVRSAFWQSLVDGDRRRAEQLVRQGRAQLYPALGLTLLLGNEAAAQRRVSVENAVVRFSRAVELAPDYLEARLLLAKAFASWEQPGADGSITQHDREAHEALTALRARDPLYEAQEVAFQLGILHARAGDLDGARAEYEHALTMSSDDEDQATLLGNLAEVTMMRGDLTRALAIYQRAAQVGKDEARVLALWGQAIALDRLGERAEALTRAGRALREDRAPFSALHQNGVFFMPSYELHYYEGLGALAQVQAEREGEEDLAQAVRRARSWSKQEKLATRPAFARLADELTEVGHEDLAVRWLGSVKGRRSTVSPPRPQAREPELPSEREARVAYWSLRALAAFTRYRRAAGQDVQFAVDADEHIAKLILLLQAK